MEQCITKSIEWATVLLLLNLTKTVAVCKDQVCDSLSDVSYNVQPYWTFVHFRNWFPVKLQYLPANFFEGKHQLEYITLKRMINGIDTNAFSGLEKLLSVVLQDNDLKNLPVNLFRDVPVEKIVIRNCKLQEIPVGLFHNLKLSHLTVEANDIKDVRVNIFPAKLQELILRNNRIDFIEEGAFQHMKKLQILDLSGNSLTTFNFEALLGETTKLKSLKLSNNALQRFHKLPSLPRLKYLYVDNNSISVIDNNAFDETPNLKILMLSKNRIETLDFLPEDGLLALKKLYIDYNNVTCVTEHVLNRLPDLKSFWFGLNPLRCECYVSLLGYVQKHDIRHPYNFDIEWKRYIDCSKYKDDIKLL